MNDPAFIFDDVCVSPDRQIGLHTHSLWELSYILYGSGTRTIGDITEPIIPKEIVLIPPHIPHVWNFDSNNTDSIGNIANISVFFESRLIESMKGIFPEIIPTLDKIQSITHAIFYCGKTYTHIQDQLHSMRGSHPADRLPGMLELLINIADTSESRFAGKNITLNRIEQRLEKVRIYCTCNYSRTITLNDISRHVGMNKSAFCTFMRRHTGLSLSEYVNGIRLERAKDKLLHTDSCIAEIALECGFQNTTYFHRLFRDRFGRTPRAVRLAGS